MAKNKIYVDGDLLAFPSASVAEDVIYIAKAPDGKTIAEFSSAKDYKRWVEGCYFLEGTDVQYGYEGHISEVTREKVIRPKTLDYAKKHFERTLEEWLSACPTGDVTVYLAPKSGQRNPRHDIALRKPYKGNRKDSHKPYFLQELREWALKLPYTKRATAFETDDLVVGMASRHGENGYVIQNEKDVFGSYNCWVYHPSIHEEPVWSGPNSIGYLEWRGKELIGLGKLFVLAQGGIFGDTADNYSGLDGAGKVKAWNVLGEFNGMSAEALPEAVKKVCQLYIDKYGMEHQYVNKDGNEAVATWFDFYEEGIRLAYMLKNRKDFPHEFINPAKELL